MRYVFIALCLVKHRDNFTFTFPYIQRQELLKQYLIALLGGQYMLKEGPGA